ncbi:MAG: type IX secretion system membrane protein PorP/SprF [Bacteroidales bacterium]|nr:type IX secretion system membrane protein PorP/SprF [Bacteroidales bacterium]
MKRIIKTILLILIPVSLAGQLAPVTNQYVLNPITINPAYAGNRGVLNVAAFYRKQWAGVQGAPETMTFSADAPVLDNKVGLGLTIISDRIGVTKETYFISNYSYILKVGEGTLAFGLGAGIITTNTAWSDLVVLDPGDELYLIDSRRFVVPSFSFGTFYSNKNYFLGFSIPKFIGYKFNYDKNKYSLTVDPGQYNFLLNTGYAFGISPKVAFIPSTLLSFTPGQKLVYDLNANFNFNNRFWAGASYRNARSVGALIQLQVNKQLKVAYTYDFDTGNLGGYSNGSHEIMLRYEFRYKVNVMDPLVF